jgi:RimJ/RimL family protein N-acetyltransferase
MISPIPLPVELARTTLRDLTMDDLEVYVDMHARVDVARYLYWEPRSMEESKAALEGKIANAAAEDATSVNLAVTRNADGAFLGELNLHVLDAANRGAEIGFIFHPDHHGQGYAGESAAALLAMAFDTFGMHRVIGRCDARNTASALLMKRLGMRVEAHFRSNEFVKGEWCDERVFAMLEDEHRSTDR